MTDQIDIARVNERISVQEERMNTMKAEYKTDIARLAEDIAKRDTETAKRETRLMLVIVGTIVAVGSLATAVLGIIITGA